MAKPFLSISPNVLTLFGLFFSVLFFTSLILHHYILAFLFLIGTSFDFIDGAVARMSHKESAYGAFLDSTIDRISDFLIISAFAFSGLVSWVIIAFFLFASILTSYIRARGELAAKGHTPFSVGILERTERLVLIGLSLFLYILFAKVQVFGFGLLEVLFLGLLILSVITVIQRLAFAQKTLK